MSEASSARPAPAGNPATLQVIFEGRRGRLLAALLLAEFGGAVQGIAYSTVLPLAATELNGAALYGATLAAATLASIFVLALGSGVISRLGFTTAIGAATVLFAIGAALSALAPAMVWILVGNVIRGLSMGVIAGWGYAALGSLYEDALRPRVMGLFAFMWLVPSLVGPPLNAAIASAVGWRWAMVWPAVLVIAARIMLLRSATVIPSQERGRRISPLIGFGIVAALALASWASSGTGVPAWAGYLVGFGGALVLSIVLLAHSSESRRRLAALAGFFGSCLVYFAAESVLPLSVVTGLGGSVLAGGVAVGAAGVAWSLVGLVPVHGTARRFGRAPIGIVLVGVSMAVLAAALLLGPGRLGATALVAVVIVAAAAIGVGMGMAYTVQSSANFDGLAPSQVAPVATAAAFAETGAVSVGSLLTGGSYSLATSSGAPAVPVLAIGFAVLAVLAGVTAWLAALALRPGAAARRAAGESSSPRAAAEAEASGHGAAA